MWSTIPQSYDSDKLDNRRNIKVSLKKMIKPGKQKYDYEKPRKSFIFVYIQFRLVAN